MGADAVHGRSIDDRAATGLQHGPDGVAASQHGSAKGGLDRAVPGGGADRQDVNVFLDRLQADQCSVVVHDVEAAEGLERRRDGRGNLIFNGDVAGLGRGPAAQSRDLFADRHGGVFADVADQDGGSPRRHLHGASAPQSRATSSHHRDFALKVQHFHSSQILGEGVAWRFEQHGANRVHDNLQHNDFLQKTI